MTVSDRGWIIEMELTVTLNHERFDHIVADHLEIGMPDPVINRRLGASEEVIEDCDFMSK